jgi:uncharacterized protein (TIGR03067 family)
LASEEMIAMWLLRIVVALAASVTLVTGDDAKLRGSWDVASADMKGVVTRIGEDELAGTTATFTFEKDKMRIESLWDGKKETQVLKIQFDPDKTPKELDLIELEGPYKGNASKAIYKIEGDTLTICIARPDFDRPDRFTTALGDGRTLYVLKRSKPQK